MRTAHRTTGIVTTLAAGLLAAGCGSTNNPSTRTAADSTNPAASVPAWYAAGGATLTTKLGADLTAIGAAATTSDTQALKTHCDDLTLDVGAATNYPPIPDIQAQQHWSAALRHLTATSQACSNSAATGNTALLGPADQEVNAAAEEMAALTARVDNLNDQT